MGVTYWVLCWTNYVPSYFSLYSCDPIHKFSIIITEMLIRGKRIMIQTLWLNDQIKQWRINLFPYKIKHTLWSGFFCLWSTIIPKFVELWKNYKFIHKDIFIIVILKTCSIDFERGPWWKSILNVGYNEHHS